MYKVYYCNACRRVINNSESCDYCKSNDIKELNLKAPVNVIGTKIKGRILKFKNESIDLLIKDEFNNKMVKEFKMDELRKIL